MQQLRNALRHEAGERQKQRVAEGAGTEGQVLHDRSSLPACRVDPRLGVGAARWRKEMPQQQDAEELQKPSGQHAGRAESCFMRRARHGTRYDEKDAALLSHPRCRRADSTGHSVAEGPEGDQNEHHPWQIRCQLTDGGGERHAQRRQDHGTTAKPQPPLKCAEAHGLRAAGDHQRGEAMAGRQGGRSMQWRWLGGRAGWNATPLRPSPRGEARESNQWLPFLSRMRFTKPQRPQQDTKRWDAFRLALFRN